ncbi:MAG: hypothetical protein GEV08_08470 [Acidimicrobiia bacterium]|nr:hypothetical protein [Acidimicrobiia bacterium]
MSWPQLLVRAALEGLAVGLAATVVRQAWRSTGRLDLVPVAAAVVVAVVAAAGSPDDGFGALALGAALLPAAGLAGAVLAAWVAGPDAPGAFAAARSPAQGAVAVLPTILVLVGADAGARLMSPDGPRAFGASPEGPRLRGDVLVSWVALVAAVGAIVVVGAAAWLLRRGPLARSWRAWRADPQLLVLSGIEPRRVLAIIGALGAAAGAATGLAAASASGTAPEHAWRLGLAVAIVLVAIGVRAPMGISRPSARWAPVLAGIALGAGSAALERGAEGWATPAACAAALALAWGRAWRFRRRTLAGVVW